MSRIGIMGGTFNPIHFGHLMLARKSYEQFHLDKVLMIPNQLPAYKETDDLLNSRYRSDMIRLAIANDAFLEFSDIELHRAGATYTIDTINELQLQYPNDDLYFIMGGDSLVHFHEWKSYRDLLGKCIFLCAQRDDTDWKVMNDTRNRLLQEVPDARIYFLETPMMDISSTEIREALQKKEDVTDWLPPAVIDYIEQNRLYLS